MNLKEKMEENLTLSILAFAIVAFGAGWAAYGTVIKVGGNETITANELAKLKDSEKQLKQFQEQKVGAQPKPKVRVVFVDAMQRRYFVVNPHQYPEGNADFLIHHIEMDRKFDGLVEPIKKLTWTQEGANLRLSAGDVVKENPDIVVIHRSAFYPEDEQVDEVRLEEFLKGMKTKDTVFLVYSRTPETDGQYAYRLGNKTGLTDRIFPYQFKLAYPFDDRTQVDPFLQTLLMLVQARMSQKGQLPSAN
jgi:hypothetical protein